jgi:hypothetical protein
MADNSQWRESQLVLPLHQIRNAITLAHTRNANCGDFANLATWFLAENKQGFF